MYYGLTFKGRHSYKEFKLVMRSDDRSLLPPSKVSQVDISFIDGRYDLRREPVYDNRLITVKFSYIDMDLVNIQQRKRLIAGWLSGQGQLIFDDEPNIFYNAKIYEGISLSQYFGRSSFDIAFECEPFALNTPNILTEYITMQNQKVNIDIEGNVRTGGKITLTNMGTTTINRIQIARERGKG